MSCVLGIHAKGKDEYIEAKCAVSERLGENMHLNLLALSPRLMASMPVVALGVTLDIVTSQFIESVREGIEPLTPFSVI